MQTFPEGAALTPNRSFSLAYQQLQDYDVSYRNFWPSDMVDITSQLLRGEATTNNTKLLTSVIYDKNIDHQRPRHYLDP